MKYTLENGFIKYGETDIGQVVTKPDGKFIAVIWPLGRIRHTAETSKEAFEEVVAQLQGFKSCYDLVKDKKERKAAAVKKSLETKKRNREAAK